MGTPISQPTPLVSLSCATQVFRRGSKETSQMLTMSTLASGAGTPPSPCYFPPGEKLLKKKALNETMDLSVFDIFNVF
jgi:hypothetical protein